MKRIYAASVTVFWLIMMGLLFQKEVLPSFIITNPLGYKIELTRDLPVRESWMGIYFKGTKIGFSNTVMNQDVDSGTAGYRINETTLLKLNLLGEDRLIRIKGSSFFTENYNLKNFFYKLFSGMYKIDISGKVIDGTLKIVLEQGTGKIEKAFPLKSNTLISNSISPLLLFKKLDKNKLLSFEIFDPITMGTSKVSIRNIGKEAVEMNGVENEADVFEIDIYGIKTKTWMSKDGDILKEESGLGFTMYKEDAKDAISTITSISTGTKDLLLEFSVPSNIEISNPRDVSYLKIERNGLAVEIFREKEPAEEKILMVPIEEIPEEVFIQSKDDKILKLAEEITGGEKNSWVSAKKILQWVHNNIKKTPTLSIPSSLDVLRTGKGDCNEHTVLFTALTRSIGIPTKMIAGLVYLDNAFYYHAWPKVYVGEWVNMDPTIGQEIADATHIPLIEGGIKEQLGLIKIISELKIKVVEYK